MRTIVFFLIIISFVMLEETAYAEDININGYTVSVVAVNRSGRLSIDGRVDGGERCKKLQLNIYMNDEKSHGAAVTAIAEDVGNGGSRTFTAGTRVYGNSMLWSVSRIDTYCNIR